MYQHYSDDREIQLQDVERCESQIRWIIHEIEFLRNWLEDVEPEETVELDKAFLDSVGKWLEIKRKYVLLMNDVTEEDLGLLGLPEEEEGKKA